MKIAILSDIHGNIFALDAVLKKVLQAEVDRIIFLGDFTGYYYHSRQVFEKLNELWQGLWDSEEIYRLYSYEDKMIDALILKKSEL